MAARMADTNVFSIECVLYRMCSLHTHQAHGGADGRHGMIVLAHGRVGLAQVEVTVGVPAVEFYGVEEVLDGQVLRGGIEALVPYQ
jgi:hypothetical protein